MDVYTGFSHIRMSYQQIIIVNFIQENKDIYISLTCRMDKGMEMKTNEAYGPVTSSQPPHAPSGTYEL